MEINTFIQLGCIKLIKSHSKGFHIVTLNFLSTKQSWKKIIVFSTKMFSSGLKLW